MQLKSAQRVAQSASEARFGTDVASARASMSIERLPYRGTGGGEEVVNRPARKRYAMFAPPFPLSSSPATG